MEKKHTLSRLISLATILLLTTSTISLLDGLDRHLELLSHFKNQYLYASIILFLCCLFLKKTSSTLLAFLAFIMNIHFVLPFYFSESDSAPHEYSEDLKIILSNVYTHNRDYQKLINLVLKEMPDILVLQEIDQKWMKNINLLYTHYPYQVIETRSDSFGIAILSKLPPINASVAYWGKTNIPSIESQFKIGDHTFYLLATHPVPPISANYYSMRNAQLSDMVARAREIDDPKLIIGDLNITPWSSDYNPLEKDTGMKNARHGFGTLPTWPAKLLPLMIPIDHLLVSNDFHVKHLSTGPYIGSDHLPLISTLHLKNINLNTANYKKEIDDDKGRNGT